MLWCPRAVMVVLVGDGNGGGTLQRVLDNSYTRNLNRMRVKV